MRKLVEPGSPGARIIAEELALWARVAAFLPGREAFVTSIASHDAELIELRDAIAEAKPEDVASLVEQMMRVSAVAVGRRGKVAAPIDAQAPYFGHLRLRPIGPNGESASLKTRDVLIGKQGLIDRAAGVQIVDWRDAPVSQLYYRYDEGDDYEEHIPGGKLQGIIDARRNVTLMGGRLRRIGCPQGNFFADAKPDDDPHSPWWQALDQSLPTLRGGQGLAARAPRRTAQPASRHGRAPVHAPAAQLGEGRPMLAERIDKHLPEIAALIDADQFALITEPESELVVIQGGAGSGKTTVALHRVAYLAYQDPARFRPLSMLVIVPSQALARYVGGVLPSLGVSGVPVLTSAAWMRGQRQRILPRLSDEKSEDVPPAVSRLKKHPKMLHVIDRYVEEQAEFMRQTLQKTLADRAGQKDTPLLLSEWDRRADLPLRARCRALRDALPRLGLRSESILRLEEVLSRLSHRAHDVVRDWAELLTDADRLRDGLRGATANRADGDDDNRVSEQDLAELLAWCKAQQEEIEPLPRDVDPERYQAVDGKPLDEGSPAGRLDEEDDPLLLRLYQRKHGHLLKGGAGKSTRLRYEHLVLDEAQDLSAVEVRVLLSCMAGLSVTIAGDVAQRLIFDNGFTTWEGLLRSVGLLYELPAARQKPVAIRHLKLLYRSTQEVMQLSRDVLGKLATDESQQQATRHGAPVQGFPFGETGEAVAFLAEALRSLLAREPTASVALISRYAGTADLFYQGLGKADVPALRRVSRHEFPFTPGIDVTDVSQVKGLEFDYVVILDATAAAYPDAVEPRHLLHIATTRCAHQLWLLSPGPPSPLIPASYFAGELGEAMK